MRRFSKIKILKLNKDSSIKKIFGKHIKISINIENKPINLSITTDILIPTLLSLFLRDILS